MKTKLSIEKRFLIFLMSTLMLTAISLLFFFAGQPERTKYEGDGDTVCSTRLSPDDYQNCLTITEEGHSAVHVHHEN